MLKRVRGYFTFQRGDDATNASQQLEREGYTILRQVFTEPEIARLKAEINAVYDSYPGDKRAEAHRTADEDEYFRYEMLNRSAACQEAIAHPQILETIEPLLGEDCHVIANTAWHNPPSDTSHHGGQAWHIDAGPHVPLPEDVRWPDDIPHPVFAIGTHIYLEPCRLEDGPTGVIPGSHLSGRFPPMDRAMDDDLTFNGQGVVPLLTKPGDVGLFVSDVWHRRMPTGPGDAGRFFLQAHYGRRDISQRLHTSAQTHQLSDQAIERADTDRARTLIGLHEPRFYDG